MLRRRVIGTGSAASQSSIRIGRVAVSQTTLIGEHPVTGQTIDEDYGVINWHFDVKPPRRRACTGTILIQFPTMTG